MSRLILEGDDKQIALLLKLAENMTDVDIVEHIPEASWLNDDDKKSPLYWLDQIRNRVVCLMLLRILLSGSGIFGVRIKR